MKPNARWLVVLLGLGAMGVHNCSSSEGSGEAGSTVPSTVPPPVETANAPAWYTSIPVGAWGPLGGGIGTPGSKIITATNPPGPNGVFWPWEPRADASAYNPATPLIQGLHPLAGTEGPTATMTSFCSWEITYDGVNENGTFIPGVFYVGTGGGHATTPDNSVYAIGPIDSDKCGYHRLSDPSIPPAEDVQYAVDGGPNSVHTYGHVAILPGNRLLCGHHGTGYPSARYWHGMFSMDLKANNRGVGGAAWRTTAKGENTWADANVEGINYEEGSTVYHAKSDYVWIAHYYTQNGIIRRRPDAGAKVESVPVTNHGAPFRASNAIQLVPIPDQPFILGHHNQEIDCILFDVTNPDAVEAYPVNPSGMTSWPTHQWGSTGYAFYGAWVWNHVDKVFNGYFSPKLVGGGWGDRNRIYTLKVPGITPGVAGDPRSTAWPLSFITATGSIPTDHNYNDGGSSCYKQIRFVGTSSMKGIAMFHNPWVEPLFFRLP